MGKGRLEAFSDGVLAIIITIMVLEIKVPHGTNWHSLEPLAPIFISYVLSFVNIAIYWNNHHHMMYASKLVNGKVLWANVHLLFWLSLIPFVTGWMGENHVATLPFVLYGIISLMAGVAYFILARSLARLHGKDSTLAIAMGKDWKGILSVVIYAIGIGICFIHPWWGFCMYVIVTGIWFIPDRRIENTLEEKKLDKRD